MHVTSTTLFMAFAYMTSCASAIAISYRATWSEGKKEGAEAASGEIADDLKDSVISGMSGWSGGKYKATLGGFGARQVVQVEVAKAGVKRTKKAAADIKTDMMKLVRENAKARSRSPSPARSKSPKPKRRQLRSSSKKRSLRQKRYPRY